MGRRVVIHRHNRRRNFSRVSPAAERVRRSILLLVVVGVAVSLVAGVALAQSICCPRSGRCVGTPHADGQDRIENCEVEDPQEQRTSSASETKRRTRPGRMGRTGES